MRVSGFAGHIAAIAALALIPIATAPAQAPETKGLVWANALAPSCPGPS